MTFYIIGYILWNLCVIVYNIVEANDKSSFYHLRARYLRIDDAITDIITNGLFIGLLWPLCTLCLIIYYFFKFIVSIFVKE